ncbi:holo-ACP synthase [Candidatus Dependentiae bacterium]|nr:holo-ACP synthase [Candidatus Dependentiae bacterium]
MTTIGTDIVSVERFEAWGDYSYDQMRHVFSKQELAYCKQDSSYKYASLAARFAAKEAFFKALSAMLVKLDLTEHEFTLLFLCQRVQVKKTTWDVPVLVVDWQEIEKKIQTTLPKLQVELSISHEKKYVVAFVVLGLPCGGVKGGSP